MRTGSLAAVRYPLLGCGIALALTTPWVAAPAVAKAQRNVAISRFRPALDGHSFLTVQTSRTPPVGRFNFQYALDWAVDPLSVGARDEVVIAHQLIARTQFQVGVLDRLALSIDAPWVLFQQGRGSPLADDLGTPPGSAAGNPSLAGRLRFFGDVPDGDQLPEDLGLALVVALSPPLGASQSFASDGAWLIETRLVADYHVLGAGVGASLGFRFRVDDEKQLLVDQRVDHELELGIGIKVPTFVISGLSGLLEFRWIADLSKAFGFSGPTNVVEGNLGVRYQIGTVSFTAAIGTELASGYGSPALRSYFAFSWAPKVNDADGDGVPDGQDDCGFLAEDRDGFEDEDGCPDPDNDNDLVFDEDDQCPNEAAEEFRDDDEDGCTDPVTVVP